MTISQPSRLSRAAGLICAGEEHYLDHLAPLCDLLGIPLFVTEEPIFDAARFFYPALQVECVPPLALAEKLIHDRDTFFVCMPKILVEEVFFLAQRLHRKKIHTIWCPHGNSDKGHASKHMEALHEEDVVLVYGQKMVDFLEQKNALSHSCKKIVVGNYRLQYYKKNQAFYDSMVASRFVKPYPFSTKIVLYAPTWKDAEDSSSFYEATEPLVSRLPPNWHLIIKPHPNLARQDPWRYSQIAQMCGDHPRVLFLTDFPPMYPLLSIVDIYIGDFSSIGYDFLYFDRPLFFIHHTTRDAKTDPGLYLYRCGTQITPKDYDRIYEVIQNALSQDPYLFSAERKAVYQYTFAKDLESSPITKEIFSSL